MQLHNQCVGDLFSNQENISNRNFLQPALRLGLHGQMSPKCWQCHKWIGPFSPCNCPLYLYINIMLVFVSIYGSRCAIGRNLVSDAKEWVVPPNVYCTRYFAADSNVSKPIGISIWTSAREKWFSYYGGNIQKPTGIFCQASWNTTPHILLQSSLLQWQLYWWIALLEEESNCSFS